ncbi:MAG: metallophosphoesterase family protein [Terricaulis sp.]
MTERTYYAIGDVHGEAERLGVLHGYIFEDAQSLGVTPTIVHVGDYIDRGPDSRGVIAQILSLDQRADVDTVSLMGNHEVLMLRAYDSTSLERYATWSLNGGDETVASYKRANGSADDWRNAVDAEHIAWLRTLPTIWRDEARNITFVHGGIDPKTFPKCDPEIHMWTRSEKFFDTAQWPKRRQLDGLLVVHGHTPTRDQAPDVSEQRINIDTGVCYGGPLTCAVLAPREGPRFLRA